MILSKCRNTVLGCLALILASPFLFAQTITIGNGATLLVEGDGSGNTVFDCDGTIHIQGELDLDNDAIVHCGGDFIKDAANFDYGNSHVIMNGNAAQTISGGTTSSTSFSFYDLTIDNSAGLAEDVIVDAAFIGTIRIRNILQPKNGVFASNNTLIINAVTISNYARVAHGNGTVTGNAEVQKRLTNNNAGWRQISMPIISSMSSANWTDISLLFSDHTNPAAINTFTWDASLASGDYANGWKYADPSDDQTKAYSVYLDDVLGGIHEVKDEFKCNGVLHLGNINYDLEFTRDPADNPITNDDALGWNFIPNPWAALVDVHALIGTPSSPTALFTPAYKAIHVWDAFSQNYRAILATGVTQITYNTGGSSIQPATTTNIAPFQGFWVKANDENQICNLDASVVQTTDQASNIAFMKTNYELMRLNVFDQDSAWNQLVVYFMDESTSNFDLLGDGYYLKSLNKNVPVFYGHEGNSKASIISRKPNTTDSIQTAFSQTKNQSQFYLNADFNQLPQGWFVYLKDKRSGKTIHLEDQKSYSFTHNTSNEIDRFVIYFSKNENAFKHLVNNQEANIEVITRNENITLQSNGADGMVEVNVYDAVGRLLYHDNVYLNRGEEISISPKQTNAVIMVETILNGKRQVEKIFY